MFSRKGASIVKMMIIYLFILTVHATHEIVIKFYKLRIFIHIESITL